VRLVVFGPQGAGKGTQGALIAEKFRIPDIATCDIFRWAISGGTALGLKVKNYVEEGRLVPDDLTIEVVSERLSADDCKDGFVLDGFPRSLRQAEALDEILAAQGVKLDAALVLEIPEEVSLRRILGRRACIDCGRNYHLDSPPRSDWTCDACGGAVEERTDDHEDTIRLRLQLYHEQTEPLKTYYEERGLLRRVDGALGTPNDVFEKILSVL
jgi:adenylate kinase